MSHRDFEQTVADAVSELREWAEENPDCTEPHDQIHEIADSAVPVYTADLLEMASNKISLATSTPELGPAFDGEPTPTNIIAANVYEAIEQELWEAWREIEQEREEAEEAALEEEEEEEEDEDESSTHTDADGYDSNGPIERT
jgi:hypothetical protein